ncbi:MAG: hypothetical protein JXA13_09610 [Anaerolineales bacterium]|nr:hypothetical protein [Anaerolineales bacterium]
MNDFFFQCMYLPPLANKGRKACRSKKRLSSPFRRRQFGSNRSPAAAPNWWSLALADQEYIGPGLQPGLVIEPAGFAPVFAAH